MNRSRLSRALSSAMMGVTASAFALVTNAAPMGAERAVVELFTSQGCSSCPPADAVVGRLLGSPTVLVLSFHVNYWDDLGWKDPFSSQVSTDRQYTYAHSLGERSVFTPQVIVNGSVSLIGSRENAIQHAVTVATQAEFPAHTLLTQEPDGGFALGLTGVASGATVWEVRYLRHATTPIRGGENGGRTLETYNNVTQVRSLGAFAPGTLKLARLQAPDDGLAVLVQASGGGRIVGAASIESSSPAL